jgi:aldehyde:ferredoxin oxidoreductase
LLEDNIGGRGINAKLLYDEVEPGINPLDPNNKLILCAGPLAGTPAPSSGRCNVTTKSPLTGIFGDSNAGGHWVPELKYAGYDHIVVSGQSRKPVYLWIEDENVEIRDASHIWGCDTWETAEIIREELGDKTIGVMCIGPAGENLVSGACLTAFWTSVLKLVFSISPLYSKLV